MSRERKRKVLPVHIGLPLFPHLWRRDASSARTDAEKGEKERQYGRVRGRENVSMQEVERNTNAGKRDERGGRTADVYHKSHCPPLTEFVEPPSLPLSRLPPAISSVYRELRAPPDVKHFP